MEDVRGVCTQYTAVLVDLAVIDLVVHAKAHYAQRMSSGCLAVIDLVVHAKAHYAQRMF